ncbi:sensor histidine kinase [Streptomyces qinzhouensis]|uniref:histidine kinase n=1 Tax=Streptomyces qinzhouensis TaxID=2599401 RepID=A0A5B8JD79_9ACTN|nr:histidine kinase [Streptomyces qinzhouensis]QDY79735.1 sensor histidine kinase [Streptomyces qinzhouensis]
MTRTEYSWLLPSAMAADPDLYDPGPAGERSVRPPARGRVRRTVRDWIVDLVFFLFAALMALVVVEQSDQFGNSRAVVHFDELVGLLSCGAIWLRRRWPVQLALGLALVGVLSPAVAGALIVAIFSLAVHRPFRPVAIVGGIMIAFGVVQPFVRTDPTTSAGASIAAGLVILLLATGWGMLVRSQRQLYVALRERAHRAETEAALRAEQAQRLAREAIAREMHDVLAHRLTLLSVHAGALEFRPDAPPAEIARAAGVIRDSSHDALQDLRQIIGVLRAPGDGGPGDRPQPTLATLDALVEESREAGMAVVLDNRIQDPDRVPAALGRTVYRIAQEGLTNARKHAPGAEVTVAVTGAPGNGVVVAVDNPAPAGPFEAVPGSGQGLIGLTERATLAGGSLEHGRTGDGGFHVRAWLPWAA